MLKTIKQTEGIPANLTKWQDLCSKIYGVTEVQQNQYKKKKRHAIGNIGYLKLCIYVQSNGGETTNPVNREL